MLEEYTSEESDEEGQDGSRSASQTAPRKSRAHKALGARSGPLGLLGQRTDDDAGTSEELASREAKSPELHRKLAKQLRENA